MKIPRLRILTAFLLMVGTFTTTNVAGGLSGTGGQLPEPPRKFVEIPKPAPPRRVHAVPAGGNFQAALDAAQPGDVITLAAGESYVGRFILPRKDGAEYITIRTSTPDGSLPAEGTRIAPADSPLLPKIVAANTEPAVLAAPGAHHYRFLGIEITARPNPAGGRYAKLNYGLVWMGYPIKRVDEIPHHIVFERCYIHGYPEGEFYRGIMLNAADAAVVDSHIAAIHSLHQEAQAIDSWTGPGPFKIVNNYLEAAGENLMFGGADTAIPGLVPSDIEIRRNHFFKPLTWRVGHPSYAGKRWIVKNLFELKNAQRVLIEGNVFENNWVMGQDGTAILFTVRNQSGSNPWAVVQDVAFKYNVIRGAGVNGFNILGKDYNFPSQVTQRLLIAENVIGTVDEPLGDDNAGWGVEVSGGPRGIVIEHNTIFVRRGPVVADGAPSVDFVFRRNVASYGLYGIFGDNKGGGVPAIAHYFPNGDISRNVLVGNLRNDPTPYPPTTMILQSWSEVGFVNLASGDYRLSPTSRARKLESGGRAPGADHDSIKKAIAGVVRP